MAVHRFQIASKKKTELLLRSMREIAVLLAETPPKEEKARIKAEAVIRDHDVIEAYGILSLTCSLLCERIKLISFHKECPPELVSSVASLLYAIPRVDIPELNEIRKQIRAKYGKKFQTDAMNNSGGIVNEKMISKLSLHPPTAAVIQTYLQKCCTKFEVQWDPHIPPVVNSGMVTTGEGRGPGLLLLPDDDDDEDDHDSANNNNNNKGSHDTVPIQPSASYEEWAARFDDFEKRR